LLIHSKHRTHVASISGLKSNILLPKEQKRMSQEKSFADQAAERVVTRSAGVQTQSKNRRFTRESGDAANLRTSF